MLFQNDIFNLEDGSYRLLDTTVAANRAWIISLAAGNVWPQEIMWSSIANLEPSPADDAPPSSNPTFAQVAKRDAAWGRIEPLIANVPGIYVAHIRGSLIERRAVELKCSERTIHKDLRRFWQGGQTRNALLPHYQFSGRKEGGHTAGRGRRPLLRVATYQLEAEDLARFHKIIKKHYVKDSRCTVTGAYQRLLDEHYAYLDGNNQRFIYSQEERPTFRQFSYFLNRHYSIEVRIRGREGDKDFERNHRSNEGTVLADCLGVGHFYEIDATIVDVYIVSSIDINKIIGKPTLYLIIDRQSRLIVGFYIGLENASWTGAKEAIASISANKIALCEYYGVTYNAEDWPADKVFPKEFLGDRGEMISGASNQLTNGLQVTVTNTPGLRPDWKSLVENSFKLIHESLKDVVPAYDPPSNAMRRRGKQYEKDACLTLHDFGKTLLLAIIAHNRKAMPNYKLSPREIADDVMPTPIALWNHGIVERSGLLTKYSESVVRRELLPTGEAVVTAEGILFKDCFYSCPEAMENGWLVRARKSRFDVTVSFDSCLADKIYVRNPNNKHQVFEATLTTRSQQYRGFSFAEVKYFESQKALSADAIEQNRRQVMAEFHHAADPITLQARKKLKAEGRVTSRTARRADIKVDRQAELRNERQERATQAASPAQSHSSPPILNNILPMPLRNSLTDTSHTQKFEGGELTPQQRIQEMRRKMLNGR
ncbi:MAG: DDE-type integrase/transposase/recombinase [Proteobacteria bacterium]|nr:DDE-type integrase/transposase/recombinase [Pseudomonadota bacterium]